MKYPAYPDYRPIQNSVFERLPVHWQMKRLKFIAEVCNGRDQKEVLDDNGPYLVYGSGGPFGCATAYLYDGVSVLLGRKGTIDKPLLVTEPFWTVDTMFYTRIAKGVDPRYFYYLCTTIPFDLHRDQTTLPSMTQSGLADIVFSVAPHVEQAKIADFLDWRTAQIDALIAKKQALLDRLSERRVNVIASCVTNGLVQQVETRPSGAAWFAQVPKHWKVKRIKFIGTVGNGSTPARDDSSYWGEGNFPWLNSSVANQEAVTEADQFVTALALKECHLPIIEPPAVLVGITGQGKTRGMATTLLIRATINQHLAYIKPDEAECDVRYLRRVFDAAYAYLRSESDGGGSTKGAITCEQIAELPVPVPPLEEQQAIAEHIDKVLNRINRIADKANHAINRLTEYRSALITAAVTGQIDVRDVTVTVPAAA